MTLLDEVLAANRKATRPRGEVGTFIADRRLCIVTCVDPRLTRFFPTVLGLERGHAVVLRVPGAHLRPDSDALRALAAAVFVNGCEEVLVIGHTDCGVARVTEIELRRVMRARGVAEDCIPADLGRFFGLVPDEDTAACETVQAIRTATFLPQPLPVHAAIMNIATGGLRLVERGYAPTLVR